MKNKLFFLVVFLIMFSAEAQAVQEKCVEPKETHAECVKRTEKRVLSHEAKCIQDHELEGLNSDTCRVTGEEMEQAVYYNCKDLAGKG